MRPDYRSARQTPEVGNDPATRPSRPPLLDGYHALRASLEASKEDDNLLSYG